MSFATTTGPCTHVHMIPMDLAGMLVDQESLNKYMTSQQQNYNYSTPFRVPRCCNPSCRRYGKYQVMPYKRLCRAVNANLGFLCRTCAPNKAKLLLARHDMIMKGQWPAPIPPQRLPKEESRSYKLLALWRAYPDLHQIFGRICEEQKFKGARVRDNFYTVLQSRGLGNFSIAGRRDHAFARFVKRIGVSLRRRRLPDDCKPPRPRPTLDDIEASKKVHTGTHRIADFLGALRGKLGTSYPRVEEAVQLARQLHLKVDEMVSELLQ